jgi:hypothetical protein
MSVYSMVHNEELEVSDVNGMDHTSQLSVALPWDGTRFRIHILVYCARITLPTDRYSAKIVAWLRSRIMHQYET